MKEKLSMLKYLITSIVALFILQSCVELKSDPLTGPPDKISELSLYNEEMDNLDRDSVLLRRNETSGFRQYSYLKLCDIFLDGRVEYTYTYDDIPTKDHVSDGRVTKKSSNQLSYVELANLKNILFAFDFRNQITITKLEACIADLGNDDLIARVAESDPRYIYIDKYQLEDKSNSLDQHHCSKVTLNETIKNNIRQILDKYCKISLPN